MTILERVVSVIAPHNCLVCGREGSLICLWCREEACPALPERCYRCLSTSENCIVCTRCRRQTPLKHVWVRTDYIGVARELVHRLKFGRTSTAAQVIASYIQESLPFFGDKVIVTHVPTATSRVRQRGYDQASIIAGQLAKIIGNRHSTLLARLGNTRQVGSKRVIRQKQLTEAFRPMHNSLIHSVHILLVDDVVTTGASLEAAAKTLKKAGAKTVDAVVFAQKLRN